jgi:hypothetical protein
MPRLQYEHGTIRPVINADGTFELTCASASCNRAVQPWGPRGNWMVWRHTAPGRLTYDASRSKWIAPFGDGFILRDSSLLFWKPLTADPTAVGRTQRFLGVIEVDSGTLVIGDPAYLLPDVRDAKPGVDYQAVIDAPSEPATVPFANGLALLLNIQADGPYSVYGEYDDEGLLRVSILLEPVEGDE